MFIARAIAISMPPRSTAALRDVFHPIRIQPKLHLLSPRCFARRQDTGLCRPGAAPGWRHHPDLHHTGGWRRDHRLTDGGCPVDGPEFSPDGQWIYFNSEAAATQPGHAQIFRMHPTGRGSNTDLSQRVNWFHIARRTVQRCLHQLPDRHARSSRRQGLRHPYDRSRRRQCARCGRFLRRAGHHQRQLMVARQPALRLCHLSPVE